MAYFQNYYPIVRTLRHNDSCVEMLIHCPEIAALAKAGQFLHILCDGKTLRRPISICEIDQKKETIRIIFDIRGEGTYWLSERKQGEQLNILGPLGNGFDIDNDRKSALFIGGGMGVPPLLEAAKAYYGKADAILGFRCSGNKILHEDFEHICKNVFLASDDGSCGEQGFVTDILYKRLTEKHYDIIYACGPNAMLEAVSIIAAKNNILCYVSMEERMGCGVGACLVCACKVSEAGLETYKHVCKDGPVFNAREVVW
jgi:dihydroorotate dehydrogenase electron transfer subunit